MVVLTCLATVLGSADGAVLAPLEIRLKPTHGCRESVVRLGDIAEVRSTDRQEATRLSRIELFPAPPNRRPRTVNLREIQDLLQLHAVNLAKCQFHGASLVRIHSEAASQTPPTRVMTSAADRQRGEELVRRAVLRFIERQTGRDDQWAVTPQLSASQVRTVAQATFAEVSADAKPAGPGEHDFQLTVKVAGDDQTIPVRVEIAPATMVVTAVRPLRRGALLREVDVQLSPAPSNVPLANYALRVEDVVGSETVRSFVSGQPIATQAIRAPRLVRRGDVVTVFARAAGVRVRTSARAMADGSHGQLIEVQTLTGRDRYSARVVDVQEVEVYPRAVTVPATVKRPPQ